MASDSLTKTSDARTSYRITNLNIPTDLNLSKAISSGSTLNLSTGRITPQNNFRKAPKAHQPKDQMQ